MHSCVNGDNKHIPVLRKVSNATFHPSRFGKGLENIFVVGSNVAAFLGDLNLFDLGRVLKEYNFEDTFVGVDPSCLIRGTKEPV